MENPFKERLEQLKKHAGYRHRGFVPIPHQLFFHEKLGKTHLLVFAILHLHLFKGKTYCFPSVRTIQNLTRLSRPSVINAIKELEVLGFIQVERSKGKPSKYYLKIRGW